MSSNRKVDLRKMVESVSLGIKLRGLEARLDKLQRKEGSLPGGTRLTYNGRPVHISVGTMGIKELSIQFSSPKDVAWVSGSKDLPGLLIAEADPAPQFNPLGVPKAEG